MSKQLFFAFSLFGLAACSNPCRDYCEVFVARTQECDLGGPSGEEFVDDCGDQMSEFFSDDLCETAAEQVESMSCEDFSRQVCDSDTAGTYECS